MIIRTSILAMSILALALFSATPSHSGSIVDESFESGFGVFNSEYNDSKVVSDGTSPLGSHSLQFTFDAGSSGGNAPDIVTAQFSSTPNEIYSRFYFKLSSGFQFHPYEQKLVFYWGKWSGAGNFYISIGSWGDNQLFGCVQGSGATYRNASGPVIQPGRWYKVDVHLTSGGVFQLWLDGALVLNFTGVPLGTFTSMAFTPVYGGDSTPVPKTQYIWFDGAQVSTTPIGSTSPGPTAPPPAPPFGLRIN
jgi:hypothetical protein